MKRFFALFLSLFVVFNTLPIKARAEKAAPSVSAQSAVLIDTASMAVLFEKNANERLGMASTTKIMTALIAAERGDFDMLVRIPDEAIGVEGSSIYLQKGEVLSLRELLYALLLQSANDAATAIAIAIAGDVDSFADMMNERAAQMGLSDTHFTNPHGLYDEEHYTTAYDLAIISAHALKNDKLASIFSTYKQTLPIDTASQKRVLVNHNK
ncbi:MAG: D-alanyl-D-alanine carboxypeptidase, partial [Clostridia bacterium]|nr:D-alanyl-D-alanine carboxypeptidase [Clostridia bacterium]